MTRTIQQLFDLHGKTALVTGGSRGLGLQMAQALGEAGARVMLSSRKAADLEESAGVLRAAGIDLDWIAADCASEADTRALADETLKRFGQVDILVNNAGAAWGAPAEEHPVEAWDKVMNLNVRGYFILSQHIARHSMIPRARGEGPAGYTGGRILNVASIAGLGGNPRGMNTIAYNTSKGAVINFTRALACEWGAAPDHRQRHLPGVFPQPHDGGHAQGPRRGKARRARAAGPPRRRRRFERPVRALRLKRRQAHHRPVAGGRWRHVGHHRGLTAWTSAPTFPSSPTWASRSNISRAASRCWATRRHPSTSIPLP